MQASAGRFNQGPAHGYYQRTNQHRGGDPKARRSQYHRREPVAFNQKRRRISAMAAASLSAFPLLMCLRIKRCQLWAERTLIPATAAAVS